MKWLRRLRDWFRNIRRLIRSAPRLAPDLEPHQVFEWGMIWNCYRASIPCSVGDLKLGADDLIYERHGRVHLPNRIHHHVDIGIGRLKSAIELGLLYPEGSEPPLESVVRRRLNDLAHQRWRAHSKNAQYNFGGYIDEEAPELKEYPSLGEFIYSYLPSTPVAVLTPDEEAGRFEGVSVNPDEIEFLEDPNYVFKDVVKASSLSEHLKHRMACGDHACKSYDCPRNRLLGFVDLDTMIWYCFPLTKFHDHPLDQWDDSVREAYVSWRHVRYYFRTSAQRDQFYQKPFLPKIEVEGTDPIRVNGVFVHVVDVYGVPTEPYSITYEYKADDKVLKEGTPNRLRYSGDAFRADDLTATEGDADCGTLTLTWRIQMTEADPVQVYVEEFPRSEMWNSPSYIDGL